MYWLVELFRGESVAGTLVLLGVIAGIGLALGSIRVAGVRIGVAGVLFSGLLLGHFKVHFDAHVLEFCRELGLVFFVYTIGLHVGPGFLSSLRRHGLALNALAAAVVVSGTALALVIHFAGNIEMPVLVGMLAGATTNTPSLAAAQAALHDLTGYTDDMGKLPTLGYAVAYPFGVIGIILTMIVTRLAFRIRIPQESERMQRSLEQMAPRIERMSIRVENPSVARIEDLPGVAEDNVVISRNWRDGRLHLAQPNQPLMVGDVVLAVGPRPALDTLCGWLGSKSDMDLVAMPGHIMWKRLIVTRKAVLGKTVDELRLLERLQVVITRVRRADMDFAPGPDITLQFGDSLVAVGEESDIEKAAREVGNSSKQLNVPELIPLFLGIVLGVIVGSWPIPVPGMPAPLKLGMAGGPLIVAIILSRVHRIGPLVWYMPAGANVMLRELGIVLFLAAVGVKSGDRFVETLTQGDGLYWMALSTLITLVPIMAVAAFARLFLKMNYLTLCGLLAGSMTDPPALAFAGAATGSEAPMVAYATVYPTTMILRVMAAQLLVLLWM